MICPAPLSPQQKSQSCKNYNYFSAINGASYMCLGETIVILFAVRLNSPDYIVSILGSMIYFGFLLLPLGKVMTAKVGATASQANFWVLRNVAALLVASAAPISIWGGQKLAIGFLILGSFFFYGFRAAGVVMSQPIVGEICDEHNRGKLLASSTVLFYVFGCVSLLLISLILKISQNIWVLSSIIVVGACIGVTASKFARQICETDKILKSAQIPIRPQMGPIFREKLIFRQLLSGMAINLAIIFIVPISILTLKKGYNISDTQALIYAIIQFVGSCIGGYISSMISAKFGPRNTIIGSYWSFALVAIFWIFAPNTFYPVIMAIPFLLNGISCAIVNIANTHYFLMSIKQEQQVVAAMFIAVATGAGAGIIGMICGGGLLKIISGNISTESANLCQYRIYFIIILLILILCSFFVHRLVRVIDKARKEQGESAVKKILSRTPNRT